MSLQLNTAQTPGGQTPAAGVYELLGRTTLALSLTCIYQGLQPLVQPEDLTGAGGVVMAKPGHCFTWNRWRLQQSEAFWTGQWRVD
jgi:hypothetical protein